MIENTIAKGTAFHTYINTTPEKSPYAIIPCPVIFVNRCRQLRRPGDCYISFENERISRDLLNFILEGKYKNVVFFSSYGEFSYTNVIFERASVAGKQERASRRAACPDARLYVAGVFQHKGKIQKPHAVSA